MAAPLTVSAVLVYTTPNLGSDGKIIWPTAPTFYDGVTPRLTFPTTPYRGYVRRSPTARRHQRPALCRRFYRRHAGERGHTKLVEWLGQGDTQVGWQLTMVFWGMAASIFLFVNAFF